MKSDVPISEPDIVKALAHPLRVRILNILDQQTASPKALADELDVPLGNVSYHVRTLASLGLIKLVDRKQRRGAIEHYYRAERRPVITDRAWAAAPGIVKEAMVQASLATTGEYVQAAVAGGGFDRDDIHLSRTTLRVDAKTWRALSAELQKTFERVRRLADEAEARLGEDDEGEHDMATVVLMLFEGGEPREPVEPKRRGRARKPGATAQA